MSEAATLDLSDGVYEFDTNWRGMIHEDHVGGMVAGGFPVKPPTDWFKDPGLTTLSPLQISNDGRVYGHIAAWHTSHIGMAGGIKPPRSKSDYAFFRTGSLETAEGSFVDVGQITLAGGHAPLEASVRETVAHYDDTNSAIMDVAVGEDKHGIWVAGALRPEVSDAQLRAVRASSVSGDWRPINGKLELVAVCSVNCPGFPIPRARVAAGTPIALVAAGVEPLIEKSIMLRAQTDLEAGLELGLGAFRERLNRLEDIVLTAAANGPLATEEADALRARVHGLATDVAGETVVAEPGDPNADPVMSVDDLRARVHGKPVVAVEADTDAKIAELRKRVRPDVAADPVVAEEQVDTTWDDGLDIAVPVAASLRARVHG